jgi:Uma2 family endonuclease
MSETGTRYSVETGRSGLTYEDYCAAYARHGVRHYWLVDAEAKTVEAFELVEGAYRLAAAVGGDDEFRPPVFPGLAMSLPILFT